MRVNLCAYNILVFYRNGGEILFGDNDPNLFIPPMVFIPVTKRGYSPLLASFYGIVSVLQFANFPSACRLPFHVGGIPPNVTFIPNSTFHPNPVF